MAKENLTLYCADIHGYGYLLDKVINYFHKMPSDTKLVFTGDYIDRGPQSRYCLEIVQELEKAYPKRVYPLMGNHEELFLDFFQTGRYIPPNGTQITVQEFVGIESFEKYSTGIYTIENLVEIMQEKHLEVFNFIENMDDYYESHYEIGVHAGLDLVDLKNNIKRDVLLWIRDEYFLEKNHLKKTIVTGHTPIEYVEDVLRKNGFHYKKHRNNVIQTTDNKLFIDKGIFKYDILNTVTLDETGELVDVRFFK